MQVTKQQIIHALETEPLYPGEWLQIPFNQNPLTTPASEACLVCAVGAVLRSLHPDSPVAQLRDLIQKATQNGQLCWGPPEQELEQGCYWNALSCFFERAWDRLPEAPEYHQVPFVA
jgi:hypothetical protein